MLAHTSPLGATRCQRSNRAAKRRGMGLFSRRIAKADFYEAADGPHGLTLYQ